MTHLFLGHYAHKHGDVYSIFTTREAADSARQEIAAQNWHAMMDGEPPADRADMARDYFERVADMRGEGFYIEECEVEGGAGSVGAGDKMLAALIAVQDDYRDMLRAGPTNEEADEIVRMLQTVDAAITAAETESQTPLGPVAVIMEGGICQGVISRDERLIGSKYLLVDYDVEGAEQTFQVPQGDGTTQDACIGSGEIGRPGIDLATVERHDAGQA